MKNCMYCKYQIYRGYIYSRYYCKKLKRWLNKNEKGKLYVICKEEK